MACVRGSRARGARRGGGAAGAADVDTSTVSGLSVSTYSPRELPPKRVLDLLLYYDFKTTLPGRPTRGGREPRERRSSGLRRRRRFGRKTLFA